MIPASEAAGKYIEEYYPDCRAAILAGSVVRGEATATSDLDLIIISESNKAPYRESLYCFGWPIETFVHTEISLFEFSHSDLKRRRPSLPRMICEGVILKNQNGLATHLKNEALKMMQNGVKPLSPVELKNCRYRITDLLDDLIGSANPEQDFFIINELVMEMGNLILVGNGEWKAKGKWMARSLKNLDEDLYRELMGALKAFYAEGNKKRLLGFVERELKRFGGRLFAGYKVVED